MFLTLNSTTTEHISNPSFIAHCCCCCQGLCLVVDHIFLWSVKRSSFGGANVKVIYGASKNTLQQWCVQLAPIINRQRGTISRDSTDIHMEAEKQRDIEAFVLRHTALLWCEPWPAAEKLQHRGTCHKHIWVVKYSVTPVSLKLFLFQSK